MNLATTAALTELHGLAWAVVAPVAWITLKGQRGWPAGHRVQHLWLAGIVLLSFVWMLGIRIDEQATTGLIGAALFALIFGRAAAFTGLCAAVVLHALLTGVALYRCGLELLVLAAFPAWTASTLQRLIEARLPRNVFVFIIGNGLFVTLAVTAATSLVLASLAALAQPGVARNFADLMAFSLLLAWGESLASGMLFSALVIFCPALVLTYHQDLYLPPRPR